MLSLKEFHDVTMKCVELKIANKHNYRIVCLKTAIDITASVSDVETHVNNVINVINKNDNYLRFLSTSIVRLLKEGAQLDVKKDYRFYKILEPIMSKCATKNCIKDIDAAVLMSNACKCVKPSKKVDEWCDEFNYRYFKGYVFNIAGIDYISNNGFKLVKNVVAYINSGRIQ